MAKYGPMILLYEVKYGVNLYNTPIWGYNAPLYLTIPGLQSVKYGDIVLFGLE